MIPGMPRRARPQPHASKRVTTNTRDKILIAAQELFAEHGLEGTSIRMIARRCGVTDPAVHYYFRSKRELFDALLLEPDYATAPGKAADREGVAHEMAEIFAWWVSNIPYVRLMTRQQLAGDSDAVAYFRRVEEDYHTRLREPLTRLFGPDAADVSEAAFTMLSAVIWNAVLSYGNDAASVLDQPVFKRQVAGIIDAALSWDPAPCSDVRDPAG